MSNGLTPGSLEAGPSGKKSIEDLAVLGGAPLFGEVLHVGRPNIGSRRRLFKRIDKILDSRWLTNDGPMLREFERELSGMLEVRHCIAVANGTIGLELLLRTSQLEGEVILPSFTFIATAHAVVHSGLQPVFCDIDPSTHLLDPRSVPGLINSKTVAILGVHLWGRPCDVEGLSRLSAEHGLRLFFDAAHALGCSRGGNKIGSFGDAEVFSFHATKFINSFEGGAITTNDDTLAAKLRLARNFGFTGYDQVDSLGTNGKMCEVAAAMGLTSLESIDEFVAMNRRNYQTYASELNDLSGIALAAYSELDTPNYQYVVLEVSTECGLNRDELLRLLTAEGVLARRYFFPGCHRMQPYAGVLPAIGRDLPHTEALAERVLCLPTGSTITPSEIGEICRLIRFGLRHGAELRHRWAVSA